MTQPALRDCKGHATTKGIRALLLHRSYCLSEGEVSKLLEQTDDLGQLIWFLMNTGSLPQELGSLRLPDLHLRAPRRRYGG